MRETPHRRCGPGAPQAGPRRAGVGGARWCLGVLTALLWVLRANVVCRRAVRPQREAHRLERATSTDRATAAQGLDRRQRLRRSTPGRHLCAATEADYLTAHLAYARADRALALGRGRVAAAHTARRLLVALRGGGDLASPRRRVAAPLTSHLLDKGRSVLRVAALGLAVAARLGLRRLRGGTDCEVEHRRPRLASTEVGRGRGRGKLQVGGLDRAARGAEVATRAPGAEVLGVGHRCRAVHRGEVLLHLRAAPGLGLGLGLGLRLRSGLGLVVSAKG